MSNPRLSKMFPLFTLGEIQLLAQGIHIIGEQNRVDKKMIKIWKRLRENLGEAMEQAAKSSVRRG